MGSMSESAWINIVIATRGGARAKTRCAAVLTPSQRATLAALMLQDVVNAASEVSGARLWLVTPTPQVARTLDPEKIRVVRQAHDQPGLNSAFAVASARLKINYPGDALGWMMGDLCALRPSEVHEALALLGSSEVVLAPAQRGGTSAVLMRPSFELEPCFGQSSFSAFLRSARARCVEAVVFDSPGFRADVDEPGDLWRLCETGAGAAAAYLRACRFKQWARDGGVNA